MTNKRLMTPEEIREALQDRRLSRVAKACGVSYTTLYKFANGKIASCQLSTLRKITNYLNKTPASND